MYITRSYIREYGATEGCPGCKGNEAGRSMPHNDECRMRIKARREQNEDGREGLKKEEQRQDRNFEKAVVRSVEEDPELRRAEEEYKRKLVEKRTMLERRRERHEKKDRRRRRT